MRYPAVLLDLDHTLFDSDASEALAFEHALTSAGIVDPGQHLSAYQTINRALWAQVERGELTTAQLRTSRFAQLVATTGVAAAPDELADTFARGLGAHGELYPGARELLDALAADPAVCLALVTNGISEVQRARIDRLGLARYFAVIAISSELRTAKPAPAIFEFALTGLGIPRQHAVMIGDSLSSDMQGGRNAGIATCWYNPHRQPRSADGLVDHEIATLDAAPAVVRG